MPYCSVPEDVYEQACAHEIIRVRVGSDLYGTSSTTGGDEDLMAVTVMPKVDVIGLSPFEGLQWRTAEGGARSTDDDTDLATYSLKKYLTLAAAGNPSILALMFAPQDYITFCTATGRELLRHRSQFISKEAGRRFLGYMQAQRSRMVDSRAGVRAPRVNRPELVAQFGYDPKFAMHMVRLGYQGIELLTTGDMIMPIPGATGEELRSIRRGEWEYEDILELTEGLEDRLKDLIQDTSLPDKANYTNINMLSVQLHEQAWRDF